MKAIITFLLIFCVIVVFHEFGHFFFRQTLRILVRDLPLVWDRNFLHTLVRMVPFILSVSSPLGGLSVWLVGVKIQLRLKQVALPV